MGRAQLAAIATIGICLMVACVFIDQPGAGVHEVTMEDPAGDSKPEAKPEAKAEAKPEAKPEAKTEAKPEAKAEAEPEAEAAVAEAPAKTAEAEEKKPATKEGAAAKAAPADNKADAKADTEIAGLKKKLLAADKTVGEMKKQISDNEKAAMEEKYKGEIEEIKKKMGKVAADAKKFKQESQDSKKDKKALKAMYEAKLEAARATIDAFKRLKVPGSDLLQTDAKKTCDNDKAMCLSKACGGHSFMTGMCM